MRYRITTPPLFFVHFSSVFLKNVILVDLQECKQVDMQICKHSDR